MIGTMRCRLGIFLILAFVASTALARDDDGEVPYRNSGSVLLGVGQKTLSRKDWGELRHQREGAVSGAIGNRYAQLALRLAISEASVRKAEYDARGSTTEIGAGVRVVLPAPEISFFLEAGVDRTSATSDVDLSPGPRDSRSGWGIGGYASAGILAKLGPTFILGVSAGASTAKVDLGLSRKAEAGGVHLLGTIGLRIPESRHRDAHDSELEDLGAEEVSEGDRVRITMEGGAIHEGTVVDVDGRRFTLETPAGTLALDSDQIERVDLLPGDLRRDDTDADEFP